MPNSNTTFTPAEYGRPRPGPAPVLPSGQPIGDARFPVPHAGTFLGLSNYADRSYLSWFDEATARGRENAERMRFDPVIDSCMSLRTYASALIPGRIEPEDSDDEYQVQCATQAQKILNRTPGLLWANRWLLDDGIFKGRTGLQQRWQWVHKYGREWNTITKFTPIDGDKLVFKWATDEVGILVSSLYPGPTQPSERGPVWFADENWRSCLTVHEFEPADVSYYNPTQAGAIHGVGIRGKLFWLWALKSHIWALATDYLEWFARGLTLFYFDGGNERELAEIQKWVNGQLGSHAMYFPRFRGGEPGYAPPVERIEAGTANSQFLQSLIMNYFDDIIKLKIVGQTLTSGTASTGLGSGVAAAHMGTFDQIVKYDTVALDETRTGNWVKPWYAANFPGVPHGYWVSDLDEPNAQALIDNATALYQMGAALPEGPLLDASGIGLPKQGDTILTQMAQGQPSAVGGTPNAIPQVEGGDLGQQTDATQLPETNPQAGNADQQQPIRMSRAMAQRLYAGLKKKDPRAIRLFRSRRLVAE